MEDAQRKAILIGVGIGAVGYILGRLSCFDDIQNARIQGFKNGWMMRKTLMETLDNVRAESESSSNDTTDTTTTPLELPTPTLSQVTETVKNLAPDLPTLSIPKKSKDEVDCFGDSGNGLARLSLQEGEKTT
jgi:hypothetical protein